MSTVTSWRTCVPTTTFGAPPPPDFSFSFVPKGTVFPGPFLGFANAGSFFLFWGGFFVCWLVLLGLRDRKQLHSWRISTSWKLNHLIPVAIQCVIFAYWSLYYPPVIDQVPKLFLQVAFAYLFHLCLSLTIHRSFVLNAAMIPVTLSINLVVWYPDSMFFLYFLTIAIALLSKEFLKINGKHLFNPSGFGASVVGVIVMLDPVLDFVGVAHQFNLPPNMTEVIFLLFLIPMFRFNMALVACGGAVGTLLCLDIANHIGLVGVPHFIWPAQFIAITLFASDPLTIPKTHTGRFVFGVINGISLVVISKLLWHFNYGDYYGKILCVPFANLFVPAIEKIPFDRFYDRLRSRIARLADWRPTQGQIRAFSLAMWAFLMYDGLYSLKLKGGGYEEEMHEQYRTRLVNFTADGKALREDNPMFVEPFTFPEEFRQLMHKPSGEELAASCPKRPEIPQAFSGTGY